MLENKINRFFIRFLFLNIILSGFAFGQLNLGFVQADGDNDGNENDYWDSFTESVDGTFTISISGSDARGYWSEAFYIIADYTTSDGNDASTANWREWSVTNSYYGQGDEADIYHNRWTED